MKKIKNLVKKHWKKILVIIIILVFVQKISARFGQDSTPTQDIEKSPVELFTLGQTKGSYLDSFCSVETVGDANIITEAAGKITSVKISEGDDVKKGDTLFTLENIQERVSVQNAKVALRSAELALSELVNNNNSSLSGSVLSQTKEQQAILVRDAQSTYLNTDLQAYPEKTDQSGSAPTISGNYACAKEGEYVLDVYSSGSDSGASIRLSGLESGMISLSTDYAVGLGSCGLEIVFPEVFQKNATWVIPVPNTRGAGYLSAKNNYENALSGKDIALNNVTASPEVIAQQKARVTQAQLQLESAYDALSKTTIKAPIAGVVSSFDLDTGDFVSNMQNVARVQSLGITELVAHVNGDESAFIKPGNDVSVNNMVLTVLDVAPSINAVTKKLKVTIENTTDIDLEAGVQYSCSIQRSFEGAVISSSNGLMVPLSAISVIGVDTFVFVVGEEGEAVQVSVETGALLGDMVMVYGNIKSAIIHDARGIRAGQILNIKE